MNKTENKKNLMVEIPLSEYRDLLKCEAWLSCLEGVGVDNWEGYDYACEMWEENYADGFED